VVVVVLSIFLRFRGPSESKPVAAPPIGNRVLMTYDAAVVDGMVEPSFSTRYIPCSASSTTARGSCAV
jgi:hypothetical protein